MKTIALLVLSACVAIAEPTPEWLAKNRAAWEQIKIEFAPSWGLSECVRIAREWDQRAIDKGWAIYADPMKPLIYLRWENEARKEAQRYRIEAERAARAEQQRRLEAAAAFNRYAAQRRAEMTPREPDVNDEVLEKLGRLEREIRWLDR
jgi:hypothetical protein